MLRKGWGFIVLQLLCITAFAGNPPATPEEAFLELFPNVKGNWAREQLASMTLEEKVGQLFMIAAYSNQNEVSYAYIEKLIREQHIGGLIFMQGGPGRQVALVNRYQNASKVPLMMAQDSEWGNGMRLDTSLSFPKNMTLGAIRNDYLLFELGQEVGRQCSTVGIQMNFAPVVDVNNNPNNPVINDRSYGENRVRVASKAIAFTKGMADVHVLGCAKHFPGHGDTDVDSHKDLPVIPHNRARLDSIELYPFREMIKADVPAIMVAHLYIPSLDATPNRASTLSPKIVNQLLKREMGFKGLTFTDALGMQGVAKYFGPGEVDLEALKAGNDVLLFSKDVPKAKEMIIRAVKNGIVSEKQIDISVLKLLIVKEWLGLHEQRITQPVTADELQTNKAKALQRRLYEASMTLVENKGKLLPLTDLSSKRFAHVQIGGMLESPFQETLQRYADVEHFRLPPISSVQQQKKVLSDLEDHDIVIVGLQGMSKYASREFGVSNTTRKFLKALKAKNKTVILTVFGSPYSLKFFGEQEAILVAYESRPAAQIAAAEAIFGANPVNGQLPVTASSRFKEGHGISLEAQGRIAFGYPEEVGMNGDVLTRKIDSIATEAIQTGATPGCAVLVMRKNRVIFDKGYGFTEYEGGKEIDAYNTLYDLASVTKVAATTITAMHLVREGKLKLDESIATYLQEFRGAGKSHIKVRNLMQHNAGLKSWIPFYIHTMDSVDKTRLDTSIYHFSKDARYCIPVAEGIYMCKDYQDSMWFQVVHSKVKMTEKVRYSDLSMIILGRIIEQVSGEKLDVLADSLFYRPMGMNSTHTNPAICLAGRVCAPTEIDNYWRGEKVEGYVHDQAAAMFGGFAGHAGLFSNLYDLAKLGLMVKDGGKYGGRQYLDAKLLKVFTSKQLNSSRKGLGWDKAEMDPDKSNPCSEYASEFTFGHSGFTGIGFWVDPKYDLVYVFLSNRTFPDSQNRKLIKGNYRTRVMDAIYESIFEYEAEKQKAASSVQEP